MKAKMNHVVLIGLILSVMYSCQDAKRSAIEMYIAPGKGWLDSLHKVSDTTFSKKYGGTEFSTAEYNVNKKAATLTQVMFDSNGNITQIVVMKDKKRVLFSEYYRNGQMKSKLSLDSNGQISGLAKYYYENGRIQKEGNYKSGLFTGSWDNYDKDGFLISIEKYDENGELLATEKK
jgi:hypothetical protein